MDSEGVEVEDIWREDQIASGEALDSRWEGIGRVCNQLFISRYV